MRAITKIIFLDEQGEKFLARDLPVYCTASRRRARCAAAMSMNMAYTKALKLIRNARRRWAFR